MLQIDTKIWDTFTTPEKMILKEETLLDTYEKLKKGNLLRLWESNQDFIVLGISNQAHREVNIEACQKDNIPILKRCSGGGTVLQGPGCLNYSFILDQSTHPDLSDIQKSNCYIMKQIRNLFNQQLKGISIKGISDLVYKNKKFSGNAQRRKKTHLLFHGTVLYNYDIQKIQRYLQFPSRTPTYRENKSHIEFCQNIPLTHPQLKKIFLENF